MNASKATTTKGKPPGCLDLRPAVATPRRTSTTGKTPPAIMRRRRKSRHATTYGSGTVGGVGARYGVATKPYRSKYWIVVSSLLGSFDQSP
jgi:hypothetical protein